MTTRQSTTLHMSGDGEDPNNGLAFSTIDAGDPEAGAPGEIRQVLEVWGTIEAPDGQILTARMKVGMPDVRDLQAFLSDHFGRGVRKLPESVRDVVETAICNLIAQGYRVVAPSGAEFGSDVEPGELYPVAHEPTTGGELLGEAEYPIDAGGHVNDLAFYDVPNDPWQPKPGDTVNVFPMTATMPDGEQKPGFVVTPRQCAVIYNGIQCLAPEGHAQQHDFGPIAQYQPDVDLFQEQSAAIMAADGAAYGAVTLPGDGAVRSALPGDGAAPFTNETAGERFILGPKNAAEQGRKRRLKLELAFDAAAEQYKVDPDNPGVVATLNEAAVALHKREPDNSRVVNFLFDPTSTPTVPQPEQHQRAELDSLPEAHFAPEPAPGYQPIPYNGGDPSLHAAEEQMEQQDWHAGQAGPMPVQTLADGNRAMGVEQQAAQAFPCPHKASDERPCLRPAGHEIELPTRPASPHVYATNPATLKPPPPYVAPVQPFQPPHLQAVPDQTNVAVMSFHEGEPGMPAAPAMPTWQAPQQ